MPQPIGAANSLTMDGDSLRKDGDVGPMGINAGQVFWWTNQGCPAALAAGLGWIWGLGLGWVWAGSSREIAPKNKRRANRNREWKDFPKPAARWTLNRV